MTSAGGGSAEGAVRIALIRDAHVFTSDPGAWDAVVESDPHGTVFHTAAFLGSWWERFGSGAPLIAMVTARDTTVGACGFEVVDRELRFLGGFDVTDYMGPVAAPGWSDAVADEVLAAILSEPSWDRADLRGLPADSPWPDALMRAARACGLRVECSVDGRAPMIPLSGSFQDYLDGLPSKTRHELRRKERRLQGLDDGWSVRFRTHETLPSDLQEFFRLHRASPGRKGTFMDHDMEAFFRGLAERLGPAGQWYLGLLEMAGAPAAAAVGFAYRGTVSLYNSAFDRSLARWAPGIVLVSHVIRMACERGSTRMDLLTGDLPYKYRFGATGRPVNRLRIER